MSKDERYGYVAGLIDMISYQAVLAGNQARAKCVTDYFYQEQKDRAWRSVFTAFGQHPDRPADEGLLQLLAKQVCGG